MSNVFSLDALREETVNRYAPVKIGLSEDVEVELKSLLRLGKTVRDSVLTKIDDMKEIGKGDAAADELSTEENDLLSEAVSSIFHSITSNSADAQTLIKALDHPESDIKLSMMMKVLTVWMEGAQVGEARS
jgi:hypothetical protein